MAKGINKVILVGYLGKDPEMRYAPSGDAVASMSLATSEQWKDKNTGEKQERTEWHRLVAFRRGAEVIGEYAKKGTLMYIEGKLQTRKWQDKDGNDRWTTEIVVDEFQFLSSGSNSRDNQASAQAYANASGARSGQAGPGDGSGPDDFDDDIPF